jgi:hypothetical protein
MGFLKKLFGKTKYKVKNRTMTEQVEEQVDSKIYVWTKSERAGKIVVEDSTRDGWLYFTDGSRINPKLVNEFLQLCENMDEAEENSSILSASATEPQKPTSPPSQMIKEVESPNKISRQVHVTGDNPQYVNEEETAASSSSIISSIVSKLSKKKKTNFEIKIGVNVPGKTVFNALKEELGEEELLEGLDYHVENQINNIIEDIKNQVKTQISKTYE